MYLSWPEIFLIPPLHSWFFFTLHQVFTSERELWTQHSILVLISVPSTELSKSPYWSLAQDHIPSISDTASLWELTVSYLPNTLPKLFKEHSGVEHSLNGFIKCIFYKPAPMAPDPGHSLITDDLVLSTNIISSDFIWKAYQWPLEKQAKKH